MYHYGAAKNFTLPHFYILRNRIREQEHILHHRTNTAAELLEGKFFYICAIQAHAPRRCVKKTHHQIYH